MDTVILSAVAPIVILLALAIAAAVLSRSVRATPIVGYLLLGVALNILGLDLVESSQSLLGRSALACLQWRSACRRSQQL